ncbi:exopolysaccharide production protein ExoZ [Pararobbsia alpina]|uniref:acyltransferase family protein n=1 Tax=Pararobbsia alpina TaxID=621374 RepID=UPI0039A753E5
MSIEADAARLTRPNMQGRRVELDFVRGLAILAVMLDHFVSVSTGVPVFDAFDVAFREFGLEGVNLFFTLSGFLVGGLLLKQLAEKGTIDAWRFIVRRIFKIWPAYYVLLIFHVIAGRHPIDSFLWQNAFHVQNFFGSSITQTWSLAIEEHFYLILPPVLLLAAKWRVGSSALIKALLGVCAVVLAARCVVVYEGELHAAAMFTQYRIDSLLAGVILAALYWLKPRTYAAFANRRVVLCVLVALTVAWIAFAHRRPDWNETIGYTIQAVGYSALIVLVSEHSGALARARLYRGIAWLGVYSYGIYLWHSLALAPGQALITHMTQAGLSPVPIWIAALVAQMVIGVTIGYVTTRAIEFPFLRLRDALFPASSRGQNPAVVAAERTGV